MKKIYYGLFILLVTLMIFSFSLQDAPTSNALSTSISHSIDYWVEHNLPQLEDTIPSGAKLNHSLRELAHITEFFILGICCMCSLYLSGFNLKRCTLLTTVYGITIAFADELLQFFISSGRAFQFIDLFKDCLGITLAIVLFISFAGCQIAFKKLLKH